MGAKTSFDGFPDGTFRFLRELTRNNDKAWFDAHRDDYQACYVAPALAFVETLGPRLQKIAPGIAYDPKVNGSLFRINRDVRFSKDKTPYKNHIDLWFWHGGRRGWDSPGLFFRMFADRLIIGAGMHKFEKSHLDRYREAVVDNRSGKELEKAINTVRAVGRYEIGGASRKSVPRGFDAAHPRAGLLLHDGLTATYDGKVDASVRSAKFIDFCVGHYKAMWPVGAWLLRHVASGGAKG